MSNEYGIDPAQWQLNCIMHGDAGMELKKLLVMEPETLTEEELDTALDVAADLWVEGWNTAVEHIMGNLAAHAHCATKECHYDMVHDELGRPIEEVGQDDEHLQALISLLQDLHAGVDSAEALRRLPVATLWAFT